MVRLKHDFYFDGHNFNDLTPKIGTVAFW